MGSLAERFEVGDRRIEPRGGVRKLRRVFGQRDPIVATLRASSAILPRAVYFSCRVSDRGPALRLLA